MVFCGYSSPSRTIANSVQAILSCILCTYRFTLAKVDKNKDKQIGNIKNKSNILKSNRNNAKINATFFLDTDEFIQNKK